MVIAGSGGDAPVEVLQKVAHGHAEDLRLVVADEGGVPEGLQDDHAVHVPPGAQEEGRRGRRQGLRAVGDQPFQVRRRGRRERPGVGRGELCRGEPVEQLSLEKSAQPAHRLGGRPLGRCFVVAQRCAVEELEAFDVGDGPVAVALGGGQEAPCGGFPGRRVDGRRHGVGQVVVRLGHQRRHEGVPVREVVVEPLHGHAELAGDRPQGQGVRPVLGDVALGGVHDLPSGGGPASLAQ